MSKDVAQYFRVKFESLTLGLQFSKSICVNFAYGKLAQKSICYR